jgi:bifunctional DNA-binding transcriptional regulator/antitoxin component of YhaV-PrlF toxin-antitoxin module
MDKTPIALVRRGWLRFLAVPVLLGAVLSAACDIAMGEFNTQETAEWRKSYPLDAAGRVEIINVNGKIVVQPSGDNTVEVVALKKGRGATPEAARAALGRVTFTENVSSSLVQINTKIARLEGIVINQGGVEVDYTVKVPAAAEVRFTTVNGGIEITGLQGRVTAETTNGGVTTRDVAGQLQASTTNGGLDIDLSKIADGGVRLDCVNGGIKVRMPREAKATISANIVNGGISAGDLSLDATGENSKRKLEGHLNGGGPRMQIIGVNGGITLSGR